MLPESPFDGMQFLDAFRVRWVYDASITCWRRDGTESNIPLASSAQTGLMSSKTKGLLDSVPARGGGFGIITKPFLSHRDQNNPDGILFGDVELVSETLGLTCVFANGDPIPAGCTAVHYAPESDDLPPGFDINFSEEFLKTICVVVPGGPGPDGDQGARGTQGAMGTGDGPTGDAGLDGADATEAKVFTGVVVQDVEDIYDTAVVNMELDSESGKLHVVKSAVKTPDDNTPADQLITSQVSRSLSFTTGFNYTILKGDDDTNADLPIILYPPKFEVNGELEDVEISSIKLSEYINKIVGHYEDKFDELADSYDQQIEEFFKEIDAAAREKLDILGEELANCEFSLPLDYCVGIDPSDCSTGASGEGGGSLTGTGAAVDLCSLSDFIFGEDHGGSDLCLSMVPTDMGSLTIAANEEVSVKWPSSNAIGSVTLPKGTYMIVYTGGALYDAGMQQKGRVIVDEAHRGYFVGTDKEGVGVQAVTLNPVSGEVSSPRKFPVSGEAHDKFDKKSVEDAYANGPLLERMIAFRFSEDGGEILIQAPAATTRAYGEVTFRIIRCSCADEDAPAIPLNRPFKIVE